jgi:hypothetical protein
MQREESKNLQGTKSHLIKKEIPLTSNINC